MPAEIEHLSERTGRHLAALGVQAIVTHFDLWSLIGQIGKANRARDMLAEAGIGVAQVGGFRRRLIEPDDELRRRGLAEVVAILPVVRALGSTTFITGCGSLNDQAFYGPHPENHTDLARDRLVKSLRTLAPAAEDLGVQIALECHLQTTLDSPWHIRTILERVGSPAIRANFDPVNLLDSLSSVYQSADSMQRMWDVMNPVLARSAHLKDVVVDDALPLHISEAPPGTGYLDLDVFFRLCKALGEGAPVIIEHLDAEEAVRAVAFIRRRAPEFGIVFG